MLEANTRVNGRRWMCLRSAEPIVNKQFAVTYEAVETEFYDFVEHVRQGYAHCAYCVGGRKAENYVYEHVICIDLDKVDYDLHTCYKKAVYKPNFIHATPSDGKDGKHSYHLLYCFAEPLTKAEKLAHSRLLRAPFGDGADSHLDNCVQIFGGMPQCTEEERKEKEYLGCLYLYSKDSTLVTEEPIEAETRESTQESTSIRQDIEQKGYRLWLENEQYEGYFDDFHCHTLRADEGRLFPLVQWISDGRGAKVCVNKVLHDGEGRRRFLYAIGVNIRILSKDTTFQEELEMNLRWWVEQCCDWGKGLDNKWISRTAADILARDFDSLHLSDGAHRYSHSFDMPAIREEGTTWQRCLANKRYAETDPVILRFLEPHLHKTIAEMLVIANDAGIEMSERTLKAFLKRNGNPHRAAKKRYQSQCAEEKKRKRRRSEDCTRSLCTSERGRPQE